LFIIHGEEESALALAGSVRERFGWETVVPDYLETNTL